MRSLVGLLAVLGLVVPLRAAEPIPADGCSLDLEAPVGILSVTAWTTPPRRPRYSLTWVAPLNQQGAQIQIAPWSADEVSPPPNRAEVFVYLQSPAHHDGQERRLELRGVAAENRVSILAHGPWMRNASLFPINVGLGRLRARAAGQPIDAVVADRSGQVLVRDTIDPAMFASPSSAIVTGRERWGVLTHASSTACPAGTYGVSRIVVVD